MRRGRILLVQDDLAIALVVEETLRAEAYEVVCTGAADALRLARELHPAVILLDYAMLGMDGAAISRRQESNRTGQSVCQCLPESERLRQYNML
jgi:CheY-like chemotaxis protein